MSKQAIIYFKDGTKDWIDPIDGESSIDYTNKDFIVISINNLYKYEFNKLLVDKIEIIEIPDKEN